MLRNKSILFCIFLFYSFSISYSLYKINYPQYSIIFFFVDQLPLYAGKPNKGDCDSGF